MKLLSNPHQLVFGLLLIITLVIFRPFLLSPGLSLVDDGYSLMHGQNLLSAKSFDQIKTAVVETEIGRFRPAYIAYFAVVIAFIGSDSIGLWVGQSLVFWLILVFIYKLVWKHTHDLTISLISACFWLLAPTVWSNSLRLGTAELRQLLFLLIALDASVQPYSLRYKDWAMACVATILAIGTKETSVLILPILGLRGLVSSKLKVKSEVVVAIAIFGVLALFASTYALIKYVLPEGYAVNHFGASISDIFLRISNARQNYTRYLWPIWIIGTSGVLRIIVKGWYPEFISTKSLKDFWQYYSLILMSLFFVFAWQYQFDRYFFLPWSFTVILGAIEISSWRNFYAQIGSFSLITAERLFIILLVLSTSLGFGYTKVFREQFVSLRAILSEGMNTYQSSYDSIQVSDKVITQLINQPPATGLFTVSDNYEVIYELGLYASDLGSRSITVVGRSYDLNKDQPKYGYSKNIAADFLSHPGRAVLVGETKDYSLVADQLLAAGLIPSNLIPQQKYSTFTPDSYWWIVTKE